MQNLELGYGTDVGRRRESNEDAYLVLLPPDTPTGVDAVVAVADGMGGHQAGEVASAMAVRVVAGLLGPGRGVVAGAADGSGYREALRHAVEQANQEIVAQGHADRVSMGTTLTVGLIAEGRLHLGHVGDSRAYMMRAGVLHQLTQDHSWVAEQVRAGQMTPEEAETHPRRNIVTRALGVNPAVEVDTRTVDLQPGDVILLSSDGLHGVVHGPEILDGLREAGTLQDIGQRLIQRANDLGGPDNVTVVLARWGAPEAAGKDVAGAEVTLVPGMIRAPRRKRWPWGLWRRRG
jgi:protein phosphatase